MSFLRKTGWRHTKILLTAMLAVTVLAAGSSMLLAGGITPPQPVFKIDPTKIRTSTGFEIEDGVLADPPAKVGEVSVFGLYTDNPESLDILCMTEAMASGKFKVRDSGSVGQLEVINRTGKPVVALGGEMLFGGRQDRIFAATTIIPADAATKTKVNVFCVESGRWSGSKNFRCGPRRTICRDKSKKYFSYDNLTHRGLSRISHEVAISGKGDGQGQVWADIQVANRKYGTSNRTNKYARNFRSSKVRKKAEVYLKPLLKSFVTEDNLIGFAFALSGEIQFVDIFSDPKLASKYKCRLLKSYALEAMKQGADASKSDAKDDVSVVELRAFIARGNKSFKKTTCEVNGVTTIRQLGDGVLKTETLLSGKLVHRAYYKTDLKPEDLKKEETEKGKK